MNLIQNAIKFSEENTEITVSIDQFIVENLAKRVGINIRVTDNGIGISRADRNNLFKMNFQT
jgi:signal transduction histidine kinase